MAMVKSICKSILKALMTEEVMKRMVVMLLEWLAARSTNKLDDKLVAEIKKALQ